MAVKDYTSQLINTLALYRPYVKPIDFSGVADSYQNAYDKANNKFLTDALSKALQGGDENQINSAFAALDPVSAVANRLSQQQMQQRRDWQLEDAERDHRWELDKLNMQHYLAKELADYKNGLANSEQTQNDLRTQALAEAGINQLKGVADRGNIGNLTRLRQNLNATTADQEKDLGEITSGIAALAPVAIQRLKDAGVSGVNTLGEFMTYVGLPQKPISKEIEGALPLIAEIVGVKNPYGVEAQQKTQEEIRRLEEKYGLR